MSLTKTAFKYGYESVDGFSRAFREWSIINPSKVKEKNMLKAFPKLSFKLTIQGGINMEYRIEKKDSFKIVGVKKRVAIQFEGESQEILKLAQSRSEEHTSELQSRGHLVCRLLLEKKKNTNEVE